MPLTAVQPVFYAATKWLRLISNHLNSFSQATRTTSLLDHSLNEEFQDLIRLIQFFLILTFQVVGQGFYAQCNPTDEHLQSLRFFFLN
jgi:hypothetical protein